jgi:hypothetical protein
MHVSTLQFELSSRLHEAITRTSSTYQLSFTTPANAAMGLAASTTAGEQQSCMQASPCLTQINLRF